MPRTLTEKISSTECLRLLQYQSFVGRIAFAAEGSVIIRPLNYLADERGLVFCTNSSRVLAAVSSRTPAVFEIDASEPLDHSGWSVIARGTVTEITEPEDLAFLRRGPLKSWAVSPHEHWIRLDIEEVSGVRIPVH